MNYIRSAFSDAKLRYRVSKVVQDAALNGHTSANLAECVQLADQNPQLVLQTIRDRLTRRHADVSYVALRLLEHLVSSCNYGFHLALAQSNSFQEKLLTMATFRTEDDAQRRARRLARLTLLEYSRMFVDDPKLVRLAHLKDQFEKRTHKNLLRCLNIQSRHVNFTMPQSKDFIMISPKESRGTRTYDTSHLPPLDLAKAPEVWTCPVCKYMNGPLARRCASCETIRAGPTPPSTPKHPKAKSPPVTHHDSEAKGHLSDSMRASSWDDEALPEPSEPILPADPPANAQRGVLMTAEKVPEVYPTEHVFSGSVVAQSTDSASTDVTPGTGSPQTPKVSERATRQENLLASATARTAMSTDASPTTTFLETCWAEAVREARARYGLTPLLSVPPVVPAPARASPATSAQTASHRAEEGPRETNGTREPDVEAHQTRARREYSRPAHPSRAPSVQSPVPREPPTQSAVAPSQVPSHAQDRRPLTIDRADSEPSPPSAPSSGEPSARTLSVASSAQGIKHTQPRVRPVLNVEAQPNLARGRRSSTGSNGIAWVVP